MITARKEREKGRKLSNLFGKGGGGSNLTLFLPSLPPEKKEERAPKMNSRFLPRNSGCQRQAPLRPSTHLGKICTKNPLSLSLISPKNFCGGISLPRRGRKRGGKERKKVESNPGSPGDMRKDKVVKKVGTLAQFLIPSPLAGGGGRRPNEDLESDRDSFLSFLPPLSLFACGKTDYCSLVLLVCSCCQRF